MSDNYVFISYSTENQSESDNIKGFLNKSGISTWMAPYDIPAGSQYASVINRAIKDCSCLLVILSKASVASTWVDREVERAINFHKTVVPVSIEDVTLNDAFEFYISITQIVRINRVDEAGLRPVVSRLKAVIKEAESSSSSSDTAVEQTVPNTEQKFSYSDIRHTNDIIQPDRSNIQTAASANTHTEVMPKGRMQYITLGSYEMERWDSDRKKAVSCVKKQHLRWEILDYSPDKKKALVLCSNAVVFRPYNKKLENIIWEKCTIRTWLNSEFYEAAFSPEEKELIISIMVSNPDNAEHGTEGGKDTEDRIFLLSLDEARKYFKSEQARAGRIYDGSWWWLRSPGIDNSYAAYVEDSGDVCDINDFGSGVFNRDGGVRPAFWVNLDSYTGVIAEEECETTTECVKQDITFGSYEMERWDSNAGKLIRSGKKQPLEWEVITYSPDKKEALVLCKNIVSIKPYNKKLQYITWEKCTIRAWLNSDFYEAAFSPKERKLIIPTTISNPDAVFYGRRINGGADTEDKIFLLSGMEINNCISSREARVRKTYNDENCRWWLRSPGHDGNAAQLVGKNGDVTQDKVNCSTFGVCPAFWIRLSP